MKLYFLRHADAVDGADDDGRTLSQRGQRECKAIGCFLRNGNIHFGAAYSSPLVRARETAEIVLDVCGSRSKAGLELDDALKNEAKQDVFDRWLGGLKAADHILLVGHAPTLAERVQHLLGFESSGVLTLPKAGMACLETFDCEHAQLVFFVSPDLIGAPS